VIWYPPQRCPWTSLVGTATSSAATDGLGPPARWAGLLGGSVASTAGSGCSTPCAGLQQVRSLRRRSRADRLWVAVDGIGVAFRPADAWRAASIASGCIAPAPLRFVAERLRSRKAVRR